MTFTPSTKLAVFGALCVIAMTAGLVGCTATRGPAHLAVAPPAAPLLPLEKLFGGSRRTHGRLSPDGRWISWIAPSGGVSNIWIAPVDTPSRARPVTSERVSIRDYLWSPDSVSVLFATDQGGDENHQLHALNVETGRRRTLISFPDVQAEIIAVSSAHPHRVLVGVNKRDPRWHDVFSLDFRSGALELVLENTGYASFTADQNLELKLAGRARPDGGVDYHRVIGNRVEAAVLEAVDLEDSRATEPLSTTRDGRTLFWLDSRGRDTAALVAQDLINQRKTVLAETPDSDIEEVLVHPITGAVEAYAANHLRQDWVALNSAVAQDLSFLKARLRGQVAVESRTRADDLWLVVSDPVSAPVTTYLYERAGRRLTKLYSARPELDGAALVPMHPVRIAARDGLSLVSYLSLPAESDSDGDGRPDRPLPTVLFVHGGPWSRDVYGYNGTHQWLANRGYAVLSVNFRGSTGFGKRFTSAGDKQWGARMQDDLHDAVAWAVGSGVTTPERVAIFGGSYGGYAVLAGLAFTPDAFACGVDAFGPSNLNSEIEALPAHWQGRRLQFYNRVGDPRTAEGRALLTARSPLFAAHRIRRPLLVFQGANDPRVKKAESDQIVRALQARKNPVSYMSFPDEGHGWSRPENNMAFSAVMEHFLASCLGGRAEPFGDVLLRSSLQAEAGADLVPGLVNALQSRAASAGLRGAEGAAGGALKETHE